MPEEVSTVTTEAVKTASDGSVKIAVEKYNELLEKINDQKATINDLRQRLNRAFAQPPVINRTIINKTTKMLSKEDRAWGATFMGLGAASFFIGALRYKRGSGTLN